MVLRQYGITTRKHAESMFPGTIHSWIHHQFNPLSMSKSHFLMPVISRLRGSIQLTSITIHWQKKLLPIHPSLIHHPFKTLLLLILPKIRWQLHLKSPFPLEFSGNNPRKIITLSTIHNIIPKKEMNQSWQKLFIMCEKIQWILMNSTLSTPTQLPKHGNHWNGPNGKRPYQQNLKCYARRILGNSQISRLNILQLVTAGYSPRNSMNMEISCNSRHGSSHKDFPKSPDKIIPTHFPQSCGSIHFAFYV